MSEAIMPAVGTVIALARDRLKSFAIGGCGLVAAVFCLLPEATLAGPRVALVVGNSDYDNIASLSNPGNDARDIGSRLRELGFALHGDRVHTNLDQLSLLETVNRFSESAAGAEIALLYFAGHGMQFDGDPHILPVDIPDSDLNIVQRRAVDLNSLLDQLNGQAELTVAIFDACREIPDYTRRIQRKTRGGSDAAWRGLSRPAVSVNSTLIAYSGGSGELVADGSGRNSPYTSMLLEYLTDEQLQRSGNDVTDIFQEVSWAFPQRHGGQRPEVIVQGVRPNHFYLSSSAAIPPKDSVPPPDPLPSSGRFAVLVTPADARVCFYHDAEWQCDDAVSLPLGRRYPVYASAAGYEAYRGEARLDQGGQTLAIDLVSSAPTPKPEPPSPRRQSYEPEMVLVRGGCYRMGSPTGEEGRSVFERQHRACVDDVYAGTTEVTFDQYDAFSRATGRDMPDDNSWGRGDRPVINVSWSDATAYAAWLARETGKSYRLPTEAEWEYAARGGSGTAWWWGDDIGSNRANCAGCGSRWDNSQTAPVGSFSANGYGLYDTVGNVWEWTCSDWGEGYVGQENRCSTGSEGRGALRGGIRSLRGGAWDNVPAKVRSANRNWYFSADFRIDNTGFRVFQDVK